MKKVLDIALEQKIAETAAECVDPAYIAASIIAILKELQDSSGIKICQNISKEDLAYREVE